MASHVTAPHITSDFAVHPDLVAERSRATFKPIDLTQAIYSQDHLKTLERLRKMVSQNPRLNLNDLWYLSKEQRYLRVCERAEEFVKMVRQYKLSEDEIHVLEVLFGEDFFLLLHLTMFIPALESMADEEQQQWWLTQAKEFKLFGTYAQTELGHGSNVAALETTAELDMERDEWVLNTPQLSSTKWWPGGLGKSCTHCICYARLKINGKDHGPHPFFLQVRDMHTHETRPGVLLMDIGAKMGYNGMDNGGMQLQGVRIPRRNLLMRYTRVEKDGTYRKVGDEKMLYAAMTYTRKQIIAASGINLAKCAVIATRYSALRRQFPALDAEFNGREDFMSKAVKEAQVLDYSSQQFIVLPPLVTSLACHWTGTWTQELYNNFMNKTKAGDFTLLSEVHLVTSALKATITMVVADQMEQLRKSAGGHGYMLASGLSLHLASYLPQATYEGDFVVLSIQAGRGLLQLVEQKAKGKKLKLRPDSTLKYVADFDPFKEYTAPAADSEIPWRDPAWQLEAFKQRSCALTYTTAQKLAVQVAGGAKMLAALDEVKIEMTRMTKAHAFYLLLKVFQDKCASVRSNEPLYHVLKACCDLFALYWIEQGFGEFTTSKVLSPDHQPALLQEVKALLREVRPNAVAIADSWAFSDHMLNSALGRYDGRAYEALFESAKHDPNNRSDVHEGYYRHLQYILHPERKSAIPGMPHARM